MTTLSTDEIRKQARKMRRELPAPQRQIAESLIYQRIKNHPKVKQAKHLSIFLSIDGELNTQPIIEYLWQQNKSVYLPVIHPFTYRHLLFIRYTKQTELIKNRFGILQPKLDIRQVMPYQKLDIIFTPLAAFDQYGFRIGMGGGYYDRLLENYQQKQIYPIGLAFACQKFEPLPHQTWDVQLPEIIYA